MYTIQEAAEHQEVDKTHHAFDSVKDIQNELDRAEAEDSLNDS